MSGDAIPIELRRIETRCADLVTVLGRLERSLEERGELLTVQQYRQLGETLAQVGIAGARILEGDLYRTAPGPGDV